MLDRRKSFILPKMGRGVAPLCWWRNGDIRQAGGLQKPYAAGLVMGTYWDKVTHHTRTKRTTPISHESRRERGTKGPVSETGTMENEITQVTETER